MAKSRTILGAIVGAAVGIVAGILTAPKSGKEVREDLKDKAGDLKTKAKSTRDGLVEKAKTTVDELGKNRK